MWLETWPEILEGLGFLKDQDAKLFQKLSIYQVLQL